VVRFCIDEEMARHERRYGITEVGLIWLVDARDGRSTVGGGLHGGEIADEAKRVKWARGKKVCCARGEVAELKSYTNLTRTQ
jgi:hypothetical protein